MIEWSQFQDACLQCDGEFFSFSVIRDGPEHYSSGCLSALRTNRQRWLGLKLSLLPALGSWLRCQLFFAGGEPFADD